MAGGLRQRGLSGRELPPEEVLAASQHMDATARALRAGGLPGTLQQLRVRVYLDLAQGLDPLDRVRDELPVDDDCSRDDGPHGAGVPDGGADPRGGTGSDLGRAPVKAVINLLVPAGTLLGWSSAPGEIPGFGLLDPKTARDVVEAASKHPETRWCATIIGADGTATAHGCAPGQHPWQPSLAGPSGSGHKNPGPGQDPSPAEADADHTIPVPDGPSCECNLGAPCRYHHRNNRHPAGTSTSRNPASSDGATLPGELTPRTPPGTSSDFLAASRTFSEHRYEMSMDCPIVTVGAGRAGVG